MYLLRVAIPLQIESYNVPIGNQFGDDYVLL